MIIPELILTNAGSSAQSVAIAQGRIVAVGRGADMENLAGPDTRIVNLQGATLLPGFHDAHCHVLGFGLTLAMVSLSGAGTISEIVSRMQAVAGEGTWLRGRGYDQNVLAEQRHPVRQDLDSITGGRPYVVLTHASGHAVAVNSRVLQLAGITRETPNPPGGTIVRDGAGEPTGVLLETAVNLAYAVFPQPSRTEKIAALRRASAALNAMGITSAVDATMGVAANDSLADIAVYREAADSGALSVRCTLMMSLTQIAALDPVPSPQ